MNDLINEFERIKAKMLQELPESEGAAAFDWKRLRDFFVLGSGFSCAYMGRHMESFEEVSEAGKRLLQQGQQILGGRDRLSPERN